MGEVRLLKKKLHFTIKMTIRKKIQNILNFFKINHSFSLITRNSAFLFTLSRKIKYMLFYFHSFLFFIGYFIVYTILLGYFVVSTTQHTLSWFVEFSFLYSVPCIKFLLFASINILKKIRVINE